MRAQRAWVGDEPGGDAVAKWTAEGAVKGFG